MGAKEFNIKYDSMEQLYKKTKQRFIEWNTELSNWENSYNQIVNMESFQGVSAKCTKSYLSEVHGLLITALQQSFKSYQYRLLLYIQGYYKIDANCNASLPENKMKELCERLTQESKDLEDISYKVNENLRHISDIIPLPYPSKQYLQDNISGVKSEINSFCDDINNYENSEYSNVNGDLHTLIDSLDRTVKEFLNHNGDIGCYTQGSIKYSLNAFELSESVHTNIDYVSNNVDNITLALEDEEELFSNEENTDKNEESDYDLLDVPKTLNDPLIRGIMGVDPKKLLLLDGFRKGGFVFKRDKATGNVFLTLNKHRFKNNSEYIKAKNDLSKYLGGTSKWDKSFVDNLTNNDGILLFNSKTNKIYKNNSNKIINSKFSELAKTVTNLEDNLNSGLLKKMSSAASDSFKESMSLKGTVDNFKIWKAGTKIEGATKALGIAGTVITATANLSDFVEEDGSFEFNGENVKNYVVNTGVDVVTSAAAGAAGAAVGSLILPPLGTVVGLAVGTAIGSLINKPFPFLGGDSLVDKVKDGANFVVDKAGELVSDVANGIGKTLSNIFW